MPDKMNDVAVDAELRGYTNEQASEAEQRAIEFLTKAVRIPGVRVDRDRYLREALDKVKATDDVIDRALASSPAAAGVPLGVLDFRLFAFKGVGGVGIRRSGGGSVGGSFGG